MTLEKAMRIKEFRVNRKASFRKVAELIEDEFPKYPDLRGNQLWREELVFEAMAFLYGKDLRNLDEA